MLVLKKRTVALCLLAAVLIATAAGLRRGTISNRRRGAHSNSGHRVIANTVAFAPIPSDNATAAVGVKPGSLAILRSPYDALFGSGRISLLEIADQPTGPTSKDPVK
jgi:hypothetical protein